MFDFHKNSIVFLLSLILVPPQKCLKTVTLIIGEIGIFSHKHIFRTLVNIREIVGLLILLNRR